MLMILAGVPGSGKTAVAEESTIGMKYKIINFGDILFDIVKKAGLAKNKDEMRVKLKQKDYVAYQKKTADEINKMKGDIILTTHMSLMTPTGFFPGIPTDVLNALKPDIIVLVEAPVGEILTRQKKDETRVRGYEFENDIELYQQFNRMYASAYSAMSGARVKIIQNRQGYLKNAVKDFREVLKTQ